MNCPACAETIPASTRICPCCHSDLRSFSRHLAAARSERSEHSRDKHLRDSNATWLSLWGWVLSLLLCEGILWALLSPTRPLEREAESRMSCMNNLRQITIALYNYREVYGTFPPAVTYRADGQPMHSWRVLILPYLDHSDMYEQYNMNEPWDSPGNRAATASMPGIFSCPSHPGGPASGNTSYLALDGPGTVMNSKQPARLQDIVDGTSDTLLLVEAQNPGVHWTEPKDLDISEGVTPGPGGLSSWHVRGFHATTADGSTRYISESISPQTLQGLLTINGGEIIGEF
jgi:Protein of unknown function (DUF1559)